MYIYMYIYINIYTNIKKQSKINKRFWTLLTHPSLVVMFQISFDDFRKKN